MKLSFFLHFISYILTNAISKFVLHSHCCLQTQNFVGLGGLRCFFWDDCIPKPCLKPIFKFVKNVELNIQL
jgi:hypothetical protein